MEPSDTQRDLAMEGKQKLGNAIITAAERIEDAYERLARVERQLNLGTTAAPSNVGDNQILAEFDSIVSEKLAGVFEAAISIGGRVELLGDLLGSLTSATRALIVLSSQCKKPSNLDALSAPLKSYITELTDMSKQSPSAAFANHVALVAEAAPAFAWDKPKAEVKEALKTLDNNVARVKKEFTDRIEHNQFVDSFVLFAQGLHALVRKFPEGLEWNSGAAPPQPKNKIVGNKCLCEYQVGLSDVIIDAKNGQSVYVLYCKNSSITVKGSPKSVTFDGCDYSTLTIEGVTPSIEIANSIGIKVKTKGKVNSVSVSRSQGTSSKLKLIIQEGDNKVEYEVPTRFKITAKGGKLETTGV